jgi:hypothetical protein
MAKNASYLNMVLAGLKINLTEPLQNPDPYQITEITTVVNDRAYRFTGTLEQCEDAFLSTLKTQINNAEKRYNCSVVIRQLTQSRKRAFNNGMSFEIGGHDFLKANGLLNEKPTSSPRTKKAPAKKAPAKAKQEPKPKEPTEPTEPNENKQA